MYESTANENYLKAKNSLLAQENIVLRQHIASLRNERIQMNQKLLEAIGAKESFKIDVIKLITNVQNGFERLKTFIEHTTSTPPTYPSSSSRQKLLNGLTMEKLLQQQRQSEVIQDIPIHKDINKNPSFTSTVSRAEIKIIEKDIHHFVNNCESNNSKVLNRKSPKVVETKKINNTPPPLVMKTKVNEQNRRCSKRLKSNVVDEGVSVSGDGGKQNAPPPRPRKDIKDNKENIEMACAFKDITNETRMRLRQAQNQAGLVVPQTPNTRGARKRKIIV